MWYISQSNWYYAQLTVESGDWTYFQLYGVTILNNQFAAIYNLMLSNSLYFTRYKFTTLISYNSVLISIKKVKNYIQVPIELQSLE